MNKIIEEIETAIVLAPKAQTKATNDTSAYVAMPDRGTVEFLALCGALEEDADFTAEIYQADDTSGTNAVEIEGYETTFTAPSDGATSHQIQIALDPAEVSKPYVAVKLSNTSSTAGTVAIAAVSMTKKVIC